MEEITRERINNIMQESVENPVPLTAKALEQQGFESVWGDAGLIVWSSDRDNPFYIDQSNDNDDDHFTFRIVEGTSLENAVSQTIELRYMHQLQRIAEYYDGFNN